MRAFVLVSVVVAVLLLGGQTEGQQVVSQCPDSWLRWQTFCYLFVNTTKITWAEAKSECEDRQGHLLRVETLDEYNFVKKAQLSYQSDMYWTALNDLPMNQGSPTKTTFMWDNDEFPLDSVVKTNWDREPDNTDYKNCVHVSIQATLSVADCNERHAYICEVPISQGTACPNKWTPDNSGTFCYLVSNASNWQQTVTREQARKVCEATVVGSSKARLIGITTPAVQTFLAEVLPLIYHGRQVFWTGLNDIQTEGTFVWADGTPYQSSNFDGIWRVEPNNLAGKENCGALLPRGRWGDFNCDDQNNYICRIALPGSTHQWNMGCGSWTRAGNKCVYTYNTPRTWSDSRQFCQSMGGDLLKFDTRTDADWFSMQSTNALLESRLPGYWIGLNDRQEETTFRWSDGSTPDGSFLYWDQEPNRISQGRTCTLMASSGDFFAVRCGHIHARTICEDVSGPCNTGWLSHAGHCYLVDMTLRTRHEAVDNCRVSSLSGNGRLFGLSSQDELTWLKSQLTGRPSRFWTGLTSQRGDGVWVWDYPTGQTSDTKLYNWASEPNNWNGNEDCVEILPNGRLNDRNCSVPTGFICQKYVSGGSGASLVTSSFHGVAVVISILVPVFSRMVL